MTFPARIAGKCANGDRIALGDLITRAPKGWAHEDCDATARERERQQDAEYRAYAEAAAAADREAHAFDNDPIAELLYRAYAGLGASGADGFYAPVPRTTFVAYDRDTQRRFAEVSDADLDARIAQAEQRVAVTYGWLPHTLDYSDFPAERAYSAAVQRRDALLALKAAAETAAAESAEFNAAWAAHKNEFAAREREQEEAAFRSKMARDEALGWAR